MDTKNVTIAGKNFPLAVIYAAGQNLELSEGEAHALNQTRHENIRNTLAKKVKEWTGSEDELAAEIAKYDDEYEFGVRRAGSGVSRDPIMVEARKLAREAIRNALKAKNLEATAEQVAEAAEKYLASDASAALREEAAANVARRQAAAAAALDSVASFVGG